jgi:hypothetical protein
MAQDSTTNYNLDKGDIAWGGDTSITLEAADDSDLGGHPVTFNGSGLLVTATDTDNLVGTALDDTTHPDSLTTEKADNYWTVEHGGLPVVVEVAGGADRGDYVEPNSAGDGTYSTVSAGPDSSYPFIIDNVDESNNLYVACFR